MAKRMFFLLVISAYVQLKTDLEKDDALIVFFVPG